MLAPAGLEPSRARRRPKGDHGVSSSPLARPCRVPTRSGHLVRSRRPRGRSARDRRDPQSALAACVRGGRGPRPRLV